MPGPKSTKDSVIEGKRTLEERVGIALNRIEDEERAVLEKLKKKYESEAEGPRVPGKKVRGIKTPWTFKDMVDRFEKVTFIPQETIRLTWNGVAAQVYSGKEITLPKPFYDIYNQHLNEMGKHPNIPGIVMELGAGALPPEG